MALLSVTLRLSPDEKDNLNKITKAVEQQARTLQALLDKLNQPDPDDGGITQEQIDAITARLKAANDRLEAAGQPAA